ncbi:MAG: hypothetical protein LBC74_02625 [Planctomycetaceae bacterium]|nr:hypothetical protein [Planctomycetaceae bacterium]
MILPPIIDCGFEFSINFDAYEALELSNDQRNKLSEVKKQHSKLQNEVALSETGIMLSVKLQPTKEELLKGNKNTYIMQRLLHKNETIKKVNLFKAEVKNSIFNILNPQQQNKLAELNFEVNRQIASISFKTITNNLKLPLYSRLKRIY